MSDWGATKELVGGSEVSWVKDIDEAIKRVLQTLDHDNLEVRFMSPHDKTILEAARGLDG